MDNQTPTREEAHKLIEAFLNKQAATYLPEEDYASKAFRLEAVSSMLAGILSGKVTPKDALEILEKNR